MRTYRDMSEGLNSLADLVSNWIRPPGKYVKLSVLQFGS